MDLMSLFEDCILLSLLLLAGYIIREIVKPFQKLYIPSSVIGGLVGLILGQQVLGIINIPDTFSQVSSVMINIIMAALIFGINTIDKDRIRGYLDFTILNILTYGVQLFLGTILGLFFTKIWKSLPVGWGNMGVFAFYGGHGVAASAGEIYRELGISENFDIGMILSTVGLITAMLIGMIFVNWGIREGKAKYLNEYRGEDDKVVTGGVLPENMQGSIGIEKVPSVAISNLALQFSIMMVAIFIGLNGIEFLSRYILVLKNIPNLTRGMIGAIVVWIIMGKTGLDRYADKKTFSSISGFALEMTVCSAIATLKLDVLTSYLMPILIYSVVMVFTTLLITIYFAPKMCKTDWFEKALMNYGQLSGETTTGLALVRCVDPNLTSSVLDSKGVSTALLLPITGLFPVLIPALAIKSEMTVLLIGLIITLASIIVARIIFWKK